MTGIFRQLRTPGVLLTALAAVILGTATLPLFGGTVYAAGIDLQNTVSISEFVIPGGPQTKLTARIETTDTTVPRLIDVADDVDALFPATGEILVSKTELMVYDNDSVTPPCNTRTPLQFCVTARAKVGTIKKHPVPDPKLPFVGAGRVKLATQLTATLPASPQTELASVIGPLDAPPFAITLVSTAGFPASGQISLTHQDTDAGGQSTEYMNYDSSCGGASDLCVTARALNPNNLASQHLPSGYAQGCSAGAAYVDGAGNPLPSGTNWPGPCPQGGVTKVTLHHDMAVKATEGFFPTGPLSVYTVDGSNNINPDLENISYAKGIAAAKLTPIGTPATTLRVVNRGNGTSTFDKTDIVSHPMNSIVAPPDAYLVCRARNESPAAFQEPALQSPKDSSVGLFVTCQTRIQPGEPPKTKDPKKLDIPITGQPLIVLNALSQPFLSTGGFCHLLYGPVDGDLSSPGDCTSESGATECSNAIDDDGDGQINEGCPPWPSPGGIPEDPQTECENDATDDDGDGRVNDGCPNRADVEGYDLDGTSDKELHLISPCITEFTPGVNLFVIVDLLSIDTLHSTQDIGKVRVVLDTITGPGGGNDGDPTTHDDCDDPSGEGDIVLQTYIAPEVDAQCTNAADDDGDLVVNDGCPAVGPPENNALGECANAIDDDSDGTVNDGCPVALTDTDGDSCEDNKELDNVQNAGGQRDPWNPWDLYDVTDPFNPGVPDGAVTADDITLVAANFLQNNDPVDRGSGPPSKLFGPRPFSTAGPDGAVTADDITVVAGSFLNSC